MISMTLCALYAIVLIACVLNYASIVQCYPSTLSLEEQLMQQQMQQMQQEQAESISETFLDEVRQMIEQKFSHSSETVAPEIEVSATTIASATKAADVFGSDEEHMDEPSTPLNTEIEERPPPKSPRPKQMSDWPKLDLRLGQVVAISIGTDGHPVLFHRADRIWTEE